MTESLAIALQLDDRMASELDADEKIISLLDAYVIDGKETADVVNADLRAAIARVAKLKEMKAEFVRPAKEIIARAEALFDPAIDAQTEFSTGLRRKLELWITDQKRIAEDARRKAETEERQRRQKAEMAAAATRAIAAQEAAELRRQADIAEQDRTRALEAGNAKEAAIAASEAARLATAAGATVESAEIKAQEVVLAAAAQTTVVAAPEKVAGFSLVANWKAEVAPPFTEEDSVLAIARAIAGVNRDHDGTRKLVAERLDLAPLLKRNATAANDLAKGLQGAMDVPTLIAVNRPSSRSRAV